MLLVAHRTPQSESGCARLARAGVQVFELDVKLAQDRLVVSHFLPVLRVPGWLENDHRKLRWHSKSRQDPTVRDLAELVPADRGIVLDLKETTVTRRAELNRRIAADLVDRSRYRVSSGVAADLDELRARGFRTWRTLAHQRDLDLVVGGGPLLDEAVTVRHTLLTPALIRRLHRVVPTIIAWTVNDVARARLLRDLGVDGLTTDNVDVLDQARRGAPGSGHEASGD